MALPYVSTDVPKEQDRQHRTLIAQSLNECIKVRPPHDITAAEIAAGVRPIDSRYSVHDVRRFMTEAQQLSVENFDYLEDVTEPLQNCLLVNHKSNVYLPKGGYLISESLPVYNQNILGACKEYVVIKPTGNFECFINSGIEFIQGSIQQLTILYNNGVQPTVFATNGNQIGIFFATVGGRSPNFFHIADVLVRGGWWAYYDSSGSYAGTLERVFAQDCQKGFYKSTGTTFRFSECICLNVNEAFTMTHHLGLTMSCCAQDGADLTAGNAANTFDDCAGLVINGWDSEGNDIVGNGTRLFYFKDTQVSLTGFTGYLNTMASAAAEICSLFDFDNSQANITACRPIYSAGSLTFAGAGTVATVLARNNSHVTLSGTDTSAATGGAPAVRYAMVGTGTAAIRYCNADFASGIAGPNTYDLNGAVNLSTVTAGTYTPTLTNTTNLAASTAFKCQYMRVGNVVTVSGRVDVDPTAAGATLLGISLPIASNIGAANDCAGTAAANGVAGQSAAIIGDAANDRAAMSWVTVDIANQAMFFSFSYEVI